MRVEEAGEAMMWIGVTRLEGLVFILGMEALARSGEGALPETVEQCKRMAGEMRDSLVRAVEARAASPAVDG